MPKFVEGYADKIVVPPGARDAIRFDDALAGFGIRKYADGKAVYIVKFNCKGRAAPAELGRRGARQLEKYALARQRC